jgi:large subunit ribosomal protein LP0
MKMTDVYDDGAILPQAIFSIDPASLLTKLQAGIRNLAGLSLEAGCPIEATVPLIVGNAFKNIAALSLESG